MACHRPGSALRALGARPAGVRGWIAGSVVALLALCASAPRPSVAAAPTRQQLAEAERLNAEAVQLFRAGKHDEAAARFMAAYQLAGKPTSVFNAARAKEDGGKLSEARALYELYLRIATNPEGVVDARKRIDAIDAKIQAEQAARADAEARAREAEARASRAEQERQEAERAAQEDARRRAAARAQDKSARTLALLPPLPGDALAATLAPTWLGTAAGEAAAAGLGPVLGARELQAAIAARPADAGPCGMGCALQIARGIGAGWALSLQTWPQGELRVVRVTLWRCDDGSEAGRVEWRGSEAGLAAPAGLAARMGTALQAARWWTALPGPAPAAGAGGALLHIEASPVGATLQVDGRPVGAAPQTVRVGAGVVVVEAVADGHEPRRGRVAVSAGEGVRVVIALPATPGAEPVPEPPPPPHRSPAPTARPEPPEPHRPAPPAETPRTAPATPPSGPTPAPDATAPPTPPRPAPAPPPAPTAAPPPGPAPAQAAPEVRPVAPPKPLPPPPSLPAATPGAAPDAGAADRPAGRGLTGLVMGRLAGGAVGIGESRLGTEVWAGGFAGIGWSPDSGPAAVVLCVGVDAMRSVDDGGAAAWTATTAWGALALPRTGGIMLGVHRHWLEVEGLGPVDQLSASLRKFIGGGAVALAFGLDATIVSSRPKGGDAFGEGPRWRVFVELAAGWAGRGLSR